MLNQNQLPGTGSIADSVEFVKKLWGIPSAGALPGMLIPTLSLDEINKKIADLKAVESWLTVNMNMLHGTIQALEVQSATIANLEAMGAIFSAGQADMNAAAASGRGGFPFSFPTWPAATAPTERPEPAAQPAAPAPAQPELAVAADAMEKAAAGQAAGPNPNAWWDLLQSQFKQAVGTALMPDARGTATVAKTAVPGAVRKKTVRKVAKPTVKKAATPSKPKSPAAADVRKD